MSLAALLLAAALVSPGAAGAASPPALVVAGVSSSGHLTNTYGWTIQKSASPGSQMVAVGSSASVHYAITTSKSSQGTITAFFSGKVCVRNLGLGATQGLAISDTLRAASGAVLATVAVDVSARPVLAPLTAWCYPYRVAVPAAAISPGAAYKDTARVTITNQAGSVGSPAGPSPSATARLPRTPTVVDGSVRVSDSNGKTFTFSAGGTVNYSQAFACPTAAGARTITSANTATIKSTGQSSTATATIHCGAPTTLSTALSDSAINPNASVTDQATITGANPNAGGTITYKVYSDQSCQTLFSDATPATNTITNATAPASKPITFDTDGTYYWQAVYSGDPDTNTLASTSPCNSEPLNVTGWQNGDLTTYTQDSWTYSPGSDTLHNKFSAVYTGGSVKVGGNVVMRFTTAFDVLAYIPTTGLPDPLTNDLINPKTSPAGVFGGDVLALQLDVDFSDAGLLPGNSALKFGDLTICNLPTSQGVDDVSAANGHTVRELLAEANTDLGGGTTTLTIDQLDPLVRSLNKAFDGGTPSSFAQSNLVNGSCT